MAVTQPGGLNFYPPGPASVPADLTRLPPGYKSAVIWVLICIYLFVLAYFALVIGSVWLVYLSFAKVPWTIPVPVGKVIALYLICVKGPVMLGSILLCLLLVKGLFKRPSRSKDIMIELNEQNHPRLFAFIRKLCEEVKAPLPKRIYVDDSANAGVFYDASILGLFWPIRKNLTIGLGLVNMVNLSEFKAMLAHEFGHLSQSAMKLGSYVYTANRLIISMVYDRDKWDDFLEAWKKYDLRISWMAYVLSWVTEFLRKILSGMYYFINLAERGLRRKMEFHADKVAVAAAGSEALVRLLYKVALAKESLAEAINDLYWASERNLYSRDLFFHQTKALERLRRIKNDPNYGILPPIPSDPKDRRPLFQKPEHEVESFWADHPPRYLREQRACQPYVVAPQDERSPWILFGRTPADVAALRQKMTELIYHHLFDIPTRKLRFEDPETVQREIDTEQKALTIDPKYKGLYDDRFLFVDTLEDWVQQAEADGLSLNSLRESVRQVYNRDWHQIWKQQEELFNELGFVKAIVEGEIKLGKGRFQALGKKWRASQARQVLAQIEGELQRSTELVKEADKTVFLYYYALARQLSNTARDTLLDYYRWARQLEQWVQQLREWAGLVRAIDEALTGDPDLLRNLGAAIANTYFELRRELEKVYMNMVQTPLPKLVGMTEDVRVSKMIFPKGLVPVEYDESFMPLEEWLGQLAEQVCLGASRAYRLDARTIHTILLLQEQIERRWLSRKQKASS